MSHLAQIGSDTSVCRRQRHDALGTCHVGTHELQAAFGKGIRAVDVRRHEVQALRSARACFTRFPIMDRAEVVSDLVRSDERLVPSPSRGYFSQSDSVLSITERIDIGDANGRAVQVASREEMRQAGRAQARRALTCELELREQRLGAPCVQQQSGIRVQYIYVRFRGPNAR